MLNYKMGHRPQLRLSRGIRIAGLQCFNGHECMVDAAELR